MTARASRVEPQLWRYDAKQFVASPPYSRDVPAATLLNSETARPPLVLFDGDPAWRPIDPPEGVVADNL